MELERRCIDFDELPECELTLEARANGTQVLTGYAAVYNRLSMPLREGGSAFREVIRPGAFDRILTRQRGKQDVVALLNHDSNMILGRTSSGTLELSSDDKGLRYTVTPPDTQVGRDTLELVRRRDLRGSSFAFAANRSRIMFLFQTKCINMSLASLYGTNSEPAMLLSIRSIDHWNSRML